MDVGRLAAVLRRRAELRDPRIDKGQLVVQLFSRVLRILLRIGDLAPQRLDVATRYPTVERAIDAAQVDLGRVDLACEVARRWGLRPRADGREKERERERQA